MPFTNRQLQGLEALGVVPWLHKDAHNPNSTLVPEATAATEFATSNSATAELPVKPVALDGLGTWLPTQALAQFNYRSKTMDRIGREDAPVLFVMDSLPLPAPESRLLNDMLRAVELDPRDTCLVTLDSAEALLPQPPLQSVLHAGTRAVLYFSDVYISNEHRAEHAFAIESRNAWCLPTLQKMQEQPQFKRQAWNSLKALQTLLAV